MCTVPSRVSSGLSIGVAAALLMLAAGSAVAQPASQTLTIGARISPRTTLRVSQSQIEIPAHAGGDPLVVGTIRFDAGARTRTGGPVLLTVEALGDLMSFSDGRDRADASIEFTGEGDGTLNGVLTREPQLVGQWVGPGFRSGQVVFRLRAPRGAPARTVPLRFVLSIP